MEGVDVGYQITGGYASFATTIRQIRILKGKNINWNQHYNQNYFKMAKTTIRNGKLFCLKCGGDSHLHLPLPIDEMCTQIREFDSLHKDCKQTWTEPQADQSKDVQQKAMWWIANGETGMSSKTMWNCLIGHKDFRINHPYDPADFSRCYKLLQAVPEWKTELHKLKPLSKEWSNLVDNWDKLTEMYELNHKENWKNYKKIGMHVLMQSLIN